jgi:type IV pilus assembly protein PilE
MQTTQQTTQTGFTLIELLIAVAIVALLAAIAVPNYTQYVERARRSDATTGITKIAAELERCYTQFSAYNNAGCTFGFASNGALINATYAGLTAGIVSEEGDYDLTIAAVAGSTAAQSYQLTATATADGSQANDANCVTFTLTHLGQKNSTPGPETTTNCW